ncbi:hypothetical protein TRVA0_007S02938 [Trichomonascus vanleenenianus]|uniref:uncharacterized protein n=1 Tax=Trichomonascus vanleenenianus TaxID=2268995 RepID=UPI003ECAAE9C
MILLRRLNSRVLCRPNHQKWFYDDLAKRAGRVSAKQSRISAQITPLPPSDPLVSLLGPYKLDDKVVGEVTTPSLIRGSNHYRNLRETGRQMLDIQGRMFQVGLPTRAKATIAGKNFEFLVGGEMEPLTSKRNLAKFVEARKIDRSIRCRGPVEERKRMDHSVDSLYLVIGAVYNRYGTSAVADLCRSMLQGPSGLYELSIRRTFST